MPDWAALLRGIAELAKQSDPASVDLDEIEDFLVRERLFTGDVSHELRTPLTVLTGVIELLERQSPVGDDQRATIARAKRAIRQLNERLNAFLLLSRAPETLERPATALRPIVEQAIEQCRPLLQGKPVSLRAELVDVVVKAEPGLVAIAVVNLVRNACLYTQQGWVVVTLERGRLRVEDSGPGLPDAVRARLFERFVRGHDGSVPGSGLGLAIVQRVTQHLGWTLAAEDREGGGSRFVILFDDT